MMIFHYHPLFLPGNDPTPYRILSTEGVRIKTFGPHEFLCVEREVLRCLAEEAMGDINH
jgi:fumarate hydratase class I